MRLAEANQSPGWGGSSLVSQLQHPVDQLVDARSRFGDGVGEHVGRGGDQLALGVLDDVLDMTLDVSGAHLAKCCGGVGIVADGAGHAGAEDTRGHGRGDAHQTDRFAGADEGLRGGQYVGLHAAVGALAGEVGKVLGGAEPDLLQLRFQKLMRAEGDELVSGLRRAIKIAGHRCNVAALGEDLLFWSDKTRMTWCFHYFGAEAPAQISEETH